MPLLYGSYTVTRGPGTFTLEPPLDLNLKAGWPLFKDSARVAAETRYRERVSPNRQSAVVPGLAPTPSAPAENALIRVEPAQQVEPPIGVAASPTRRPAPRQRESWPRTRRPSRRPSSQSWSRKTLLLFPSRRRPKARPTPTPVAAGSPVVAAASPVAAPPGGSPMPLRSRMIRSPPPRAAEFGKRFRPGKCPSAGSSRLLICAIWRNAVWGANAFT